MLYLENENQEETKTESIENDPNQPKLFDVETDPDQPKLFEWEEEEEEKPTAPITWEERERAAELMPEELIAELRFERR